MNIPINETGKRIQNYVFNYSDFLGAGNFSKCYKGYNQITRDIVAIKIVELNSLKSKKLEELLFQEIQILKKLNHPSVLKCYEIFTSNRNCYIITELCNQGNLENQLQLKNTFEQTQANPIIKDVYEGLLYLAENNIVHRDLKSANIFMHNGRAKIADFGFAKEIKHNFKDLNIGSPLYMAPQGILHNVYGPKTEVWALGILVYEMFHGSSPYINCKTQEDLKRSVSIPLNWKQLRADLSQDIKQFILTCLEINEQKRASIQQLSSLGYIRRLNSISLNAPINRFDVRTPSTTSAHLINTNKGDQRNFQPQYQRVNGNFRPHNEVSRNFSINKNNERQVVFKSVDMRGNNRHNTYDFQSPKKGSIFGQVTPLNFNSQNMRTQTINSLRPTSSRNHSFINNPPNMINLVNQPLNFQPFQFSVLQPTQQNMKVFPNQTIQKPGDFVFIDESQTRPDSLNKNKSFQQTSNLDKIGYDSMNGFIGLNNQLERNQNLNNIQSQKNIFAFKLSKEKKDAVGQNISSNLSGYIFKDNLNFKEAIFFIHHCRLIFKFLYLYKETSYFDKQVYLKIFQYILSLLTELNKLGENNRISTDGEKSGAKIKKFREVNIEYLSKYTKQLKENNYNVLPEPITQTNLNQINLTLRQVSDRFNESITLIKRKNMLDSSEQSLIVLGHLCIVILASLKEIELGIQSNSFKKLLQFRQIETVLNTPKEQFTVASYNNYRQSLIV